MPFDINQLPRPAPKPRLSSGTQKKEGPGSRAHFKRHTLADIASARNKLESEIARANDPALRGNSYIRRYTPQQAEKLRKENEYQNFLKRMIFKFNSTGKKDNLGDSINTTDIENANKYKTIWNRLTPAEKEQVIAASGHADYTLPKKLAPYLPKPLPKSAVQKPELNYGHDNPAATKENYMHYDDVLNVGGPRKVIKSAFIDKLKKQKESLEKKITTPDRYRRPPLPTEKEADEMRRNLDRDVFKQHKLFKFTRGIPAGESLENPKTQSYLRKEFETVWNAMSPQEKDEYIARETAGMSPQYIRKKYGIPSLMDELPQPKKPVATGPKRVDEGSRAFEKEKLLSDIKTRDEAVKRQIQEQKLSQEAAAPLIQENEYKKFLDRQLFKFDDRSFSKIQQAHPFNYDVEIDAETNRRFPGGMGGLLSGPNWQAVHQQLFNDIPAFVRNNQPGHEVYVNSLKDPRARDDSAGASQYASIWEQLTPAEKNQVMASLNYQPKGFEYYMPPAQPEPLAPVAAPPAIPQAEGAPLSAGPQPEAPPVVMHAAPPAVEQKVPQEQAAIPPLFQPPVSREAQAEESRRLRAERKHLKEWRQMWENLSPVERQQVSLNNQAQGVINDQRMNQYITMARQYGVPMQFEPNAYGAMMPPAMLAGLMGGQEPAPRVINARPRPRIHDRIMANFDPNLFNPEFIAEDM